MNKHIRTERYYGSLKALMKKVEKLELDGDWHYIEEEHIFLLGYGGLIRVDPYVMRVSIERITKIDREAILELLKWMEKQKRRHVANQSDRRSEQRSIQS